MGAQNKDIRPMPAKVYPALPDAQGWVVEAPLCRNSAEPQLRTFTGRAALPQALEYAYRTYAAASCFSR